MELTPAERDFRDAVRRFFAEEYPSKLIDKIASGVRLQKIDQIQSQRALNAKGWLGVGWPKEHGGTGWSPVERYIFDQELDLAGAAPIVPMGVIYIGPIICAFGNEEQKRTWLPGILESRDFWAQGYSEPESGSDLASLRMAAVRDGDEYVLNGTKIWTSGAQWANWIFCLCRTSKEQKRNQGISLICARLDSPGVTVHPIRLIDGSCELNRVEFDNVRVPVANRIGNEGEAWHYANVLLKGERLSYAHIGAKRRDLAKLRQIACTVPAGFGGTMADDPIFKAEVASVESRLDAIETAVVTALRSEITMAGAAALKIACTECAQELTRLFIQLAGRWRGPMLDRNEANWSAAAPLVPKFGPHHIQSYLMERAQTIYGGSTEIQKGIIWRTIASGNLAGQQGAGETVLLKESLSRWFGDNYPFVRRRSDSEADRPGEAWDFVAVRMGLLDPAGIGIELEQAAMWEAGRALLAEPLGEAWVAAGVLRAAEGPAAQELQLALAQGEPVVMAWTEPDMRDNFCAMASTVERDGSHWVLNGAKAMVVGAPRCKRVIVAARSALGLSLLCVPLDTAGVTVHAYRSIDGRPAADIEFRSVRLPAGALIGVDGEALTHLEAARDHAIALQSAEAAGLLEAVLLQTLEYTSQRRQFGQPIAEFQALQFTMVDMFLEVELAKAASIMSGLALRMEPDARARSCSSAHVAISRACRLVGEKAIQLHGGMGMTDDLPLGHFVRRALMIECAWGDAHWHLQRMAAASDAHN